MSIFQDFLDFVDDEILNGYGEEALALAVAGVSIAALGPAGVGLVSSATAWSAGIGAATAGISAISQQDEARRRLRQQRSQTENYIARLSDDYSVLSAYSSRYQAQAATQSQTDYSLRGFGGSSAVDVGTASALNPALFDQQRQLSGLGQQIVTAKGQVSTINQNIANTGGFTDVFLTSALGGVQAAAISGVANWSTQTVNQNALRPDLGKRLTTI